MSATKETWSIDVRDLCKSFEGKPAVNGVSIRTKPGEIYGFLGPNGSGKTTTIRMLCGLLTPDSGTGTCLGFDILNQSAEIKMRMGYMTQKFSLYEDLSIYENLNFVARMYGLANRTEKIRQSLEFLGISLDQSSQLAGNLSGGWKQRLALAAAVIHDPKLLLLDEPTAGVDPKARRDFWDEIHRLSSQRGVTTLVSTHYMDEAERCDALTYISFGKIMLQGTVAEMIEQVGLSTWGVEGPDLDKLAVQLRQQPNVAQVANYGRMLHVSGKDPLKLADAIRPYQIAPYHWQEIHSTLEDIFIYSMPKENNKA